MNILPVLKPALHTGLSGIQLPVPKYLYPPPFENTSRLTYYSSLSIEINSTFYKIPQPVTVSNWAAAVAGNFTFTFKLWKGITHNKNLEFNSEDLSIFFTSINPVQNKKGCLLIQFPPGLDNFHIVQLNKLLVAIKQIDITESWKIAVEFRNMGDAFRNLSMLNSFLKIIIKA